MMNRTRAFFSILVATVIMLSSGWLFYKQRISNPAPEPIPPTLAGLHLMVQETGPQAASNFFQLHGKQFPITSGTIGIYGNNQATLWVAGTPLKSTAAEMVYDMQKKIATSRSPFTPTGEISSNEQTIYSLKGMGQEHYYFQTGKLVIWLAVDPSFSQTALQQLMEYYP